MSTIKSTFDFTFEANDLRTALSVSFTDVIRTVYVNTGEWFLKFKDVTGREPTGYEVLEFINLVIKTLEKK